MMDIPHKRRKLENGSIATDALADWDDEDCFTSEQFKELDLLASQVYQGLDQNNSGKHVKDVTTSTLSKPSTSKTVLNSGDLIDIDSYKQQLESLKNERYALEGEAKILREKFKKRDTEYEEERKMKQKYHDGVIASYKQQLSALKADLEKSKTELQFKEREKNDVIDRLREVESNKKTAVKPFSNSDSKQDRQALKLASASADDQNVATHSKNKFSSRFSFKIPETSSNSSNLNVSEETKSDVKVEKRISPYVLDACINEPNIEAELAVRLLNELNVTIGRRNLTCVEDCDNIVRYIDEVAKMLPLTSHLQDLQFRNDSFRLSENSKFGMKFKQLVVAIHEFYSKLMTELKSSELDFKYTSSVIFTLQLIKVLIDYVHQMEDKVSRLRCFDPKGCQKNGNDSKNENVDDVDLDFNWHLLLDDSIPLLDTLKKALQFYPSFKQKDDRKKVMGSILEVMDKLSFCKHYNEISKLSPDVFASHLLQNFLMCAPNITELSLLLRVMTNLCLDEQNISRICLKTNQCVLPKLSECLNQVFKDVRSSSCLVIPVLQMMLNIVKSESGIQLLSSQCPCVSEMIQCTITLIWKLSEDYIRERDSFFLKFVKKGVILLKHFSSQISDFKLVRSASENEYVSLLANLANLNKISDVFSDREGLVIQELWDLDQDDHDLFDFDKNDSTMEVQTDNEVSHFT